MAWHPLCKYSDSKSPCLPAFYTPPRQVLKSSNNPFKAGHTTDKQPEVSAWSFQEGYTHWKLQNTLVGLTLGAPFFFCSCLGKCPLSEVCILISGGEEWTQRTQQQEKSREAKGYPEAHRAKWTASAHLFMFQSLTSDFASLQVKLTLTGSKESDIVKSHPDVLHCSLHVSLRLGAHSCAHL